MAVSISMNIIQNSQSIENNTSNVTVEVYAHWTRGSYNGQTASDGYPDARGTVSIDNVSYAFYSKFNTGHTTSGSERIYTKTLDISHNNEGEKVLGCWASYYTGVSSGTVSTTATLGLTTIPRKSVLTASNGTLGTAQTLNVERKSTLLTHTIEYSCGNAKGTICTKSTSTSLSWTPPVSLAAQYPNSTSVPVTFTITTYNGDTNIGASTVTISCAVPASVAPSVSLAVSDPTGYLSKYGAYVQGKSTIRIVATASGNQGSSITAYKTEADGKSYTDADVTTDVIKGTGTLTIKVTVTDSRGRTATASTTISVLAYTAPNISSLSVSRCDSSGNASSSGVYLAVRFNAAITALNSKNSATYTVQYKKSSETSYTTQTLTAYAGNYSVSSGVFIFAAETASSYDVILTAKDDFANIPKSGVGSSIKKTWSMLKNGLGFAFGKIAEVANCLDMGWFIKMNGNKITELATPTDSQDAVNKSYVDTNFALDSFVKGITAQSLGAARLYNQGIQAGKTASFTFPYNSQTFALVMARGWAGPLLSCFVFSGYGPGETRANIHHIAGGTAVQVSVNKGSDKGHGFSIKALGGDLHIGVAVLVGGAPTIELTEENALSLATSLAHPISNGGTGATDAATALTNLGGASIKLLWENASPTSSFEAQTISLDLSSYQAVLIYFNTYIGSASYAGYYSSTIAKVGQSGVQSDNGETGAYMTNRAFIVNTTGIEFKLAYYAGSYGTSSPSWSSNCLVPYEIYGIKGIT